MSIAKNDSIERVKWGRLTLLDWFRKKWNDVKHAGSMYVYFRGVLVPSRVDSDGNIIYTYNGVDESGKEVSQKTVSQGKVV